MGLTTAQIQTRLDNYLAAEEKILQNQSYTIGNRTYTRANLRWIQDQITQLNSMLSASSGNGTIRVRRVIFRDD